MLPLNLTYASMVLGSIKNRAIFGDGKSRLHCQNKSSTTAKRNA